MTPIPVPSPSRLLLLQQQPLHQFPEQLPHQSQSRLRLKFAWFCFFDSLLTIQTAINSSALARDCGPLFVRNGDITWLDRYVSGCAEDTSLLGVNPAWVAAAMQDMQSQVMISQAGC